MSGYINNVVRYAIRHYCSNRNSYYAMMLGTFGVPLLFGYASQSAVTAAMLGGAIALFDLLFVLHLSTVGMRSKSSFILENTLPLSVAERYTFIMLNSMVVATLLFALCFIPAVAIMKTLLPPIASEEFLFSDLVGDLRLSVGTLATHAILLVVNLTARMRVVMNYLAALGLMFLGQLLMEYYIAAEHIVEAKMWINAIIAIVGWVSGYFILRYKDIKL